jgi:hypothetical protein
VKDEMRATALAGEAIWLRVKWMAVKPSQNPMTGSGQPNSDTGTLTVANLGSARVAGAKFTLFSPPLANGAALTVDMFNSVVNMVGTLTTITVILLSASSAHRFGKKAVAVAGLFKYDTQQPSAPDAVAGYPALMGIAVGVRFAICTVLLFAVKLNKPVTIEMADELAGRGRQFLNQA